MTAKYSIRTSHKYNTFEPIAVFSDSLSFDVLTGFCDAYFDTVEDCTGVEVVNLETGEVVYGTYIDDGFEDNCDDDCGFDPYLGCYTDDC